MAADGHPPVGGLALFTLFSPELGLWVGTFRNVIAVRQNTVQLMTAGSDM